MKINKIAGNELHKKYQGQSDRQSCYIELDCKNEYLTAGYNPEIGNAIPSEVAYGHDIRWSIPCLTADTANELLTKIAPHAEQIIEGYESRWNGNNQIAEFSAEAKTAIDAIQQLCDEYGEIYNDDEQIIQSWDAEDYLSGVIYYRDADGKRCCYPDAVSVDVDDCGTITATSTDGELNAIETKIIDTEPNTEINGLDDYLEELRQSLARNR